MSSRLKTDRPLSPREIEVLQLLAFGDATGNHRVMPTLADRLAALDPNSRDHDIISRAIELKDNAVCPRCGQRVWRSQAVDGLAYNCVCGWSETVTRGQQKAADEGGAPDRPFVEMARSQVRRETADRPWHKKK